MKLTFSQNFNIRQKLFFVFFMSLFSIGMLGVISYYNFSQIEEKFIVVESAYDLSNLILEIRRYEKNYFLFTRENDLNETKRFIIAASDMIDEILPNIKNQEQLRLLNILAGELEAYHDMLEHIHLSQPDVQPEESALMGNLRNSGQKLVQLSQNLVSYERELILQINSRLKNNFILSIILISIFFVFLIFYIIRKVIRPLKIIEDATQSIATGQFEKLDVWNTNDEIQQVVVAFNKMVAELEKRQDQLVQAQKLSSIGTLASGIAHQVNNPLNNISTSCQILIEDFQDGASEHAKKMMKNIESETFRARDIVRGLLEFSRNQEFVLTENRLSEVVDRSVKLVSSQIPAGIEIIRQIPDDIVLNIDRQRMQEAFLNLIMNAVQAISPNPGKISVIASRDEEAGKVNIYVEDTGKGIPEKIRNRIFDPFFTTKDVGLGTGLGLYIVYGIIERHRGTIQVDTLIIGGTRFIITLPLQ